MNILHNGKILDILNQGFKAFKLSLFILFYAIYTIINIHKAYSKLFKMTQMLQSKYIHLEHIYMEFNHLFLFFMVLERQYMILQILSKCAKVSACLNLGHLFQVLHDHVLSFYITSTWQAPSFLR